MSRNTAASPGVAPVGRALREHEGLAGLLARVRASQARLEVVGALLPEGLRAGTRAGPLDDAAWTLLVESSAEAAKLRQLLPQLQAALQQAGLGSPQTIRLKVRPRLG